MPAITTFIGRLTADPDIKRGPNWILAKIRVAQKRTIYVNKEEKEISEFFDVTAWGKTAEGIDACLRKGDGVIAVCETLVDSWDDKTTGKKMYKTGFKATHVGAIVYGDSGGPQPSNASQSPPSAPPAAAPSFDPPPFEQSFPEDDDVPF